MSVSLYSGKSHANCCFAVNDFCSDQRCFLAEKPGMERFGAGRRSRRPLPSAMFMLFALRHGANAGARRVARSFAIGEGLKVVITIVLLIVALGVFKAEFIPLGLTYLAVLVVQIVAPAVINSYRN